MVVGTSFTVHTSTNPSLSLSSDSGNLIAIGLFPVRSDGEGSKISVIFTGLTAPLNGTTGGITISEPISFLTSLICNSSASFSSLLIVGPDVRMLTG